MRRAIEVFNRDGPEAATAFMDSEIEWPTCLSSRMRVCTTAAKAS